MANWNVYLYRLRRRDFSSWGKCSVRTHLRNVAGAEEEEQEVNGYCGIKDDENWGLKYKVAVDRVVYRFQYFGYIGHFWLFQHCISLPKCQNFGFISQNTQIWGMTCFSFRVLVKKTSWTGPHFLVGLIRGSTKVARDLTKGITKPASNQLTFWNFSNSYP